MSKILKILSGMHLGAQIEFPAGGALSLGRSEDCALILDDLLLAEEHVRLSPGSAPGSVVVEFLSGGFVGEKGAAAGHRQPLGDWEVVTIGATQFCVGPPDTVWKSVALPDWQKLQAASAAATDEGAARETAGASGPGSPGGDGDGSSEEAAGAEKDKDRTERTSGEPVKAAEGAKGADGTAGSKKATPLPDAGGTGRRGRKPSRALMAFAALLVVPVVAVPLLLLSLADKQAAEKKGAGATVVADGESSGDSAGDSAAVRKQIEEICARNGLACSQADGKLLVSGIVKDQATQDTLFQELRAKAEGLELRLVSEQQLLKAAQAVIKGFGYPVTASVSDAGVVSLKGSVPDNQKMKLVLSRLQSDVPGASRFDLNLELLSQVNDTLTSELTAMGLDGVKMELRDAVLRSRGMVPSEKQEAWRAKLESWKKRFPMSIQAVEDKTLVEEAAPEEPEPEPAAAVAVAQAVVTSSPLASPIASIRLQPLPSFQTRDGNVYFGKAPLASGYLVDEIELTGVWIRQSGGDESERKWVGLGQAAPVVRK